MLYRYCGGWGLFSAKRPCCVRCCTCCRCCHCHYHYHCCNQKPQPAITAHFTVVREIDVPMTVYCGEECTDCGNASECRCSCCCGRF